MTGCEDGSDQPRANRIGSNLAPMDNNSIPEISAPEKENQESVSQCFKTGLGVELDIEITRFQKEHGVISKIIELKDGKPKSDGSPCWISRGLAKRWQITSLQAFADLISEMPSNQAIALGAMHEDLPARVQLRTKDDPESQKPGFMARTGDMLSYRLERPAFVLLDFDKKSMPEAVRMRLEELGGFDQAIEFLCSGIASTGYVKRASTSSGLFHSETKERYPSSGGLHLYLLINDGSDAGRFLKALQARAWLNGLGWYMVSKSGALLERSIIDISVANAERLIFEGKPLLVSPLAQDERKAEVRDGCMLDTVTACRDLDAAETQQLKAQKAQAAEALGRACGEARKTFIETRVKEVVDRGVDPVRAKHAVEKWCEGELLPSATLVFDDDQIGTKRVGDILLDPERYVGMTLADPIEGVDYGKNCAIVLRRHDTDDLYIYSFAHGRADYALRHDRESVEAAINAASKGRVAQIFCETLLAGGVNYCLNPVETKVLTKQVAKLAGVGIREVESLMEFERATKLGKRAKSMRQAATARDRRKATLNAPFPDAEALPVMMEWDSVMCAVQSPEPPMRNLSGFPVFVLEREPAGELHELTSSGANDDEPELSRLPPPKQILLTQHDLYSVELELGDHITLLKETEIGVFRVAPPRRFIDHWFHLRGRSRLPRVTCVLTMPLVLSDGTLLAKNGLDRRRRFVMRCETKLLSFIPERLACDETAVLKAFEFVVDEWLIDVAADLSSKCVLLAYALTILERVLCPARPAFLVTAGQRASGKTTVLTMLALAVLGETPPAAAWARDEDERRKALLGYLADGLPTIVWDNIRNGTVISSPVIEQLCTAETYCDRKLGATETLTVPAYTVNAFTGNNVRTKGDLASRCLQARLAVDRPDPQNRSFVHTDPIQWTRDHRGEILQALYTLLLGNPQLDPARAIEPKTRFKTWWSIVGAAIEFASDTYQGHHPSVASEPVDFSKMFDVGDEEDEDAVEMSEVLEILERFWPNGAEFSAADLFGRLGTRADNDTPNLATLRQFFTPRVAATCSTKSVGRGLKTIVGRPLRVGENGVLVLRSRTLHKQSAYCVERKNEGSNGLFDER